MITISKPQTFGNECKNKGFSPRVQGEKRHLFQIRTITLYQLVFKTVTLIFVKNWIQQH